MSEPKRLTEAKLDFYRRSASEGKWVPVPPLLDHIDCLRAETRQLRDDRERLCGKLEAQDAELARLKNCDGVDVDGLCAEFWGELGQQDEDWMAWNEMTASEQDENRRAMCAIISRLSQSRRPLTDEEVERLAEKALSVWYAANEGVHGDMCRVVRFLADKLPPSGSSELAELRAKCEKAQKDAARWEGEFMALTTTAKNAGVKFVRLDKELKVVNLAADELRTKLEAAERRYNEQVEDKGRIAREYEQQATELRAERDQQRERAEKAEAKLENAPVATMLGESFLEWVPEIKKAETESGEDTKHIDTLLIAWGRQWADKKDAQSARDRLAAELAAANEQLASTKAQADKIAAECGEVREQLAAKERELTSSVHNHGVTVELLGVAAKEADETRQQLAAVREQRDGLVRACDPFAKVAADLKDEWSNDWRIGFQWCYKHVPTAGDYRELDAALAAAKGDEDHIADANKMVEAAWNDRETLGRHVRDIWIRWAKEQPNPKPSWLVPYDELAEADKEADRQIGEGIMLYAKLMLDAERGHAANKMVESPEATGFRAFATNRARSQAAGYAARGEQPPTLGSECAPTWDLKAIIEDLAKQPAPSRWKSLAGAVDACERAVPLLRHAIDELGCCGEFFRAAEVRDALKVVQETKQKGAAILVEHYAECARQAKEQDQFECPECGGHDFAETTNFDDTRKRVECISDSDPICHWKGTWADVRAARLRREACVSVEENDRC